MPPSMLFWIVWLIIAVASLIWWPRGNWPVLGGILVVLLLSGILGWSVFGPIVQHR